jgi:hypothetical protein
MRSAKIQAELRELEEKLRALKAKVVEMTGDLLGGPVGLDEAAGRRDGKDGGDPSE